MDAALRDIADRLSRLEISVSTVLSTEERFNAIEAKLASVQPPSSTFRDWLQAFAPYISGVTVVLLGFFLKDSVDLALHREQLNLDYVKEMRDLIHDFDTASSQEAAIANAVGLSMFGSRAITPLVERLEEGDVAQIAAERGLRLIGADDSRLACPKFIAILDDRGRRFKWQTQKTVIRVIGQSSCTAAIGDLAAFLAELDTLAADATRLAIFSHRYSETKDFDKEAVSVLKEETTKALATLRAQVGS